MTDDCRAERSALKNVWPESTLLLCQFHILQALWRWLQSDSETKSDKQRIINNFKKIMYSKCKKELDQEIKNFIDESKNFKKLEIYINSLLAKKQYFCSCFRVELPLYGVNTNNIAERYFLNLKEYIFKRMKSLNIIHVIKLIALFF